jgi:hypothetical protein
MVHPVTIRQNHVKNCLIKGLIVSIIPLITRSTQTSIMLDGKFMLNQILISKEVARRFAGVESRLASPETRGKVCSNNDSIIEGFDEYGISAAIAVVGKETIFALVFCCLFGHS